MNTRFSKVIVPLSFKRGELRLEGGGTPRLLKPQRSIIKRYIFLPRKGEGEKEVLGREALSFRPYQ